MCDPLEFWASDYLYLHAFRAFSCNTFLVEGDRRVEVLELNQVRVQDIISPAARCLECKVVWERTGLLERLRSIPWSNPGCMV